MQQQNTQEYNISVTGRHVLVTDAMKSYVEEKIAKVEHFSKDIIDVHVVMDIQKQEHKVDIVIHAGHITIKTHASTPDMYASIDKVVDRLSARLNKYKSKIQEHHAKGLSAIEVDVSVIKGSFSEVEEINDAIEEENIKAIEEEFSHTIVSTEKTPLKMLTYDEALMKMELSGDHFMVFKSEEEQKLKVIYKRNDGDFGIISPE